MAEFEKIFPEVSVESSWSPIYFTANFLNWDSDYPIKFNFKPGTEKFIQTIFGIMVNFQSSDWRKKRSVNYKI